MTQHKHLHDWIILLGLVIFWGSSFAFTKVAVSTISPVWVMALRLCTGALFLIAILMIRKLSFPVTRQWLIWYGWLGMIGSVLPFFLISWGSQHIASGLVGIMMALIPLSTLILAHYLLRDEPITSGKITGFIIGFLGLVILLGPQLLGDFSFTGLAFLAQIAIILAGIFYALQTVTARLSPELSPLQKSTGVLIAASLTGLAFALVHDPLGMANADMRALSAVIILGLFPTGFAAIMLFHLVDSAGASFVAVSNYLIPPFAYFTGILALGETFEWRALFGLMVILFGIFLIERSKRANTSR